MIRLSRLPGTVLRYLGLANSNVYPTMQIGKYYYHNYLFNASLRSWLVPDARLANKTNPEPKKEQPK